MFTFIVFVLVLSVLVFVHEFGHFIAAKRQKIGVEEFGFGFPPRMVGVRRVSGKWQWFWGNRTVPYSGDTVYSVNWIPAGGFVRIKGEESTESGDPENFASRGAWARGTVISMGVIFNLLLAVALIGGGYMVGLPQVLDGDISRYARVSDRRIEVLAVLPESPAFAAGIRAGDRIVSIDGGAVASADGFRERISSREGQELLLGLRRVNEPLEVRAVPKLLPETGKAGIGIGFAEVGTVRYPWWLALPKGAQTAFALEKATFEAFGGMLRDLVLGHPSAAGVAGPVGIAVLTGQAARQGWVALLQFTAILSINLSVINILPFPALDGGRLLFIILEKIRRRPVSRRLEIFFHNAGFLLLLVLILVLTVKDVSRYAGAVIEWIKELIR